MKQETHIYNLLFKSDLDEILNNVLYVISESGKWQEAFPNIIGFERHTPEDFEGYPNTYRSGDHAIAHQTVKYPELHEKMVEVVKAVIKRNKTAGEPYLVNIFEHAGTHYATELALCDKQYVMLYADFLCSNNLHYERFQRFDFVSIIRCWGWAFETYYLLFARWFAGGEYCSDDIDYLIFYDSLSEQLYLSEEIDVFLSALATFLVSINYIPDNGELDEWTFERFRKLVREHIYRPCNFAFPENEKKAEVLLNHFPKTLEQVKNSLVLSEIITEGKQFDRNVEDEFIPEI